MGRCQIHQDKHARTLDSLQWLECWLHDETHGGRNAHSRPTVDCMFCSVPASVNDTLIFSSKSAVSKIDFIRPSMPVMPAWAVCTSVSNCVSRSLSSYRTTVCLQLSPCRSTTSASLTKWSLNMACVLSRSAPNHGASS